MHTIDCDSLIFDMDGTLWDAIDSYCLVWDKTFADQGLPHEPVTRNVLMRYMGHHLEDIVDALCTDVSDRAAFVSQLDANERSMMPVLGGKLYPHVSETIKALSKGRRLFMVSNCGSHGLENFLELSGIKPYITEALSHGGTGLDKSSNIKLLIDKYGLKTPFYVGDTQGDADAATRAGARMIYCAYGFGHVAKPDYTINCFKELEHLVKIHE